MGKIRVDYKALGMMGTNCYFVCNTDTMETLVIDPADQAQTIIEYIGQNKYIPKAVLLTHGHFDHIGAADEVCRHFHIKLYMYEDEADVAHEPDYNLSSSFMGPLRVYADETFADGQMVNLAGMDFKVIHTPGHTKGSCCYYFEDEKILISGDTLFCQSVGRSDFPTGSTAMLLKSIGEKLFVLPKETKVYPGHGEETTIGYEKEHNCCAGYLK